MPTVDIISPGGAFSPAAVGDGVTDDAPAFRAFNTWAQAQVSPITLALGSGAKTFLFSSADPVGVRNGAIAYNVSQPLTVIGNGRTTSILKTSVGGGLNLGGAVIKSANSNFSGSTKWTARLNSVTQGTTTLTCSTIADALNFSNNTYALLGGLDMMGQGSPPNHFFFEFVYLTNVDTGTGVITIQTGTENAYLTTWPVFAAGVAGSSVDQGGPATLYALNSFDIDVTYQSLGINGNGQSYCSGRSATFIDVKCIDVNGITPSLNKTITFTNCDLTAQGVEYDKAVDTCIFDSTSMTQLDFQSANKNVIMRNGSTATTFNGTPRNLTVTDSTVGTLRMGPTGFGRMDNFITSGSTFTTVEYAPVQEEGGPGNPGISTIYSIASNGIITMTKATMTYGCTWAIPGTRCAFTAHNDVTVWSPQFTVSSVVDNGTTVSVQTDYTGHTTFPREGIRVLPFSNLDVAPNTVSSDAIMTRFKNRFSRKVLLRNR